MDPRWQFVIFLVGTWCFFMATFFDGHPPWASWQKYVGAGLFCFILPFMWSAATAGW